MTFKFGQASEDNLVGVRGELIAVVRRALSRSTQDFGVFEGLRSFARQKELFVAGASRTLESYHLTGEAVDLVPYVGGRLQWQMPLCYRVARAMREASLALSVPLVWGGVWDKHLGALDPDKFEQEVSSYATRWRIAHPEAFETGKGPLVDGPHFQRVRT